MREIKFKRYYDNGMNPVVMTIDDIEDEIKDDEWQPYSYQTQFIGLLDKNGKEIYEEDIVETPYGKRIIKWNQLHCSYCLFTQSVMDKDIVADWVDKNGDTPKQWEKTSFEVIGNIYENPELLKANQE